jgi:hypothetical protein
MQGAGISFNAERKEIAFLTWRLELRKTLAQYKS